MTNTPENAERSPAGWPPPTASRSERRSCAKRRHEGLIKAGYCVLCGVEVGLR